MVSFLAELLTSTSKVLMGAPRSSECIWFLIRLNGKFGVNILGHSVFDFHCFLPLNPSVLSREIGTFCI